MTSISKYIDSDFYVATASDIQINEQNPFRNVDAFCLQKVNSQGLTKLKEDKSNFINETNNSLSDSQCVVSLKTQSENPQMTDPSKWMKSNWYAIVSGKPKGSQYNGKVVIASADLTMSGNLMDDSLKLIKDVNSLNADIAIIGTNVGMRTFIDNGFEILKNETEKNRCFYVKEKTSLWQWMTSLFTSIVREKTIKGSGILNVTTRLVPNWKSVGLFGISTIILLACKILKNGGPLINSLLGTSSALMLISLAVFGYRNHDYKKNII